MNKMTCRKPFWVFGTIGLLFLVGCGGGSRSSLQPNPIANFHLRESVRQRPLVEKALVLVNSVLSDNVNFRLTASWIKPAAPSAVFVYLVRGEDLSQDDFTFVPDLQRCIFVNADRVDKVSEKFAGYGLAGLEFVPEEALATLLLHEAGHIYFNDSGSYARSSGGFAISDLSSPIEQIKDKELRADIFVADQISQMLLPGVPQERFTAAMTLSLFVGKVSWNLSTNRLLGHFGATTLKDPRVFLDRGYSHLNLELRFLVINYRLNPSSSGADLLRSFLEGRQTGGGRNYSLLDQ